jgi:pimeloyl-ACP methyl ester carboxylesterase
MRSRCLLLALLVTACGGGADEPTLDASVALDAAADAPAPGCDTSGLTATTPVPATTMLVRPSDTARGAEVIDDVVQGQMKRHVVSAPNDPARRNGQLFVWMAGSGAEPTNFDTIVGLATTAGYVAVSLAYDNETSVGDRCGVANDPVCGDANPDCEEGVREEMIYGSASHDSTCVAVTPANAIEHRILRLVQYLAANAPGTGAAAWLTAGGTALDWSKIAVGGWSQGGGHAGMLARDHRVARAIYASKGAGSAPCPTTVADPRQCDLDGDGGLTAGNLDELLVPVPWAKQPRLTPGSRQFGAIHAREDAWYYSRETFATYGMGAKGDEVDLDSAGSNYAAYGCRRTFVTRAIPACGATDFHKSMATDACLARGPGGQPVLAPFYYYALAVPVPAAP